MSGDMGTFQMVWWSMTKCSEQQNQNYNSKSSEHDKVG